MNLAPSGAFHIRKVKMEEGVFWIVVRCIAAIVFAFVLLMSITVLQSMIGMWFFDCDNATVLHWKG